MVHMGPIQDNTNISAMLTYNYNTPFNLLLDLSIHINLGHGGWGGLR